MKKLFLILITMMFSLGTFAQDEEPNVLRYHLKNGTTYDVTISQLDRLQKVGSMGWNNIFNNGLPNKTILFADVDFVEFVYDSSISKDNNVNRNKDRAKELEYPHLRDGATQLLVIHSTTEYGITYSLEWDCTKKTQRWTCYEFHNGIPDNNVGRVGSWQDDTLIPEPYRTHSSQYSGTSYSRGHMCMSSDRQASAEQNKQTFYISNAHPQYQKHNGGLWNTLENKVNGWGNNSSFRDTLYVVKAGTIEDGQVLETTSSGLVVPKYFYMAVLCVKNHQYKALAFWTEHTNVSITKANWKDYAITVDELEEKTGIDFFCNLPDDIEEQVEESLDTGLWP